MFKKLNQCLQIVRSSKPPVIFHHFDEGRFILFYFYFLKKERKEKKGCNLNCKLVVSSINCKNSEFRLVTWLKSVSTACGHLNSRTAVSASRDPVA